MINPLDRPPTLPPGIEAKTIGEMHRAVLDRLETEQITGDDLEGRAWRAVMTLVEQGYVTLWGMKDGEATYVPVAATRRTKQAVMYIW